MIIRGYSIATRTVVMAVSVLVAALAILFLMNSCQSRKTAAKRAEVSKGQAGAAIDSGVIAVETASNVASNDMATDAQVATAQAEIAAAAKGQKGAAAKRAACRFKAYKDTSQCKEPVR
jgi:hypothetical protein